MSSRNLSVSEIFNNELTTAIKKAVKELVEQEVAKVTSVQPTNELAVVAPTVQQRIKPKKENPIFSSQTAKETFLNFKPRVVELCAGTGGIGLGFIQAGAEVTVACEVNEQARATFLANHNCKMYEDVLNLTPEMLGQYEILASGFPCQPFSMAGKRKGFKDPRGKVALKILELIKDTLPPCVLLENVQGLLSQNKGRAFKHIKKYLTNLGYTVHHKILKSSDFNVPQNRKRVFIVALLGKIDFHFPKEQSGSPKLKEILEDKPYKKLFLSQTELDKAVEDRKKQVAKGNGFGFSVLDPNKPCRTLLKSESVLIKCIVAVPVGRRKKVLNRGTMLWDYNGKPTECYMRYLSVRECARIQGYPDSFKFPVPDKNAYEQIGNAVSVPVIREIAKEIISSLMKAKVIQKDPTQSEGETKVQANKTQIDEVYGNSSIGVSKNTKIAIQEWQKKDTKNHYSTPNALIKYINEISTIELDAASSPEINLLHQIPRIYTKNENGLKQDMKVSEGHSVFINPPYDNLLAWSEKICEQAIKYPNQPFFLLVPARATDTRWYKKAISVATHTVQLGKRLIHNEAIDNRRANFPSVIIVFNGNCIRERIYKFKKIGTLSFLCPLSEFKNAS